MHKEITLKGKIIFDPKDITNKHKNQASWKKVAMVVFKDSKDGSGLCDYYGWFIKKRFDIVLNTPLRGPHISFINDHIKDLNGGFYNPKKSGTESERQAMWERLKKKYHNTDIDITVSVDIETNGEHWWLRIPHEHRQKLYDIRSEVGLPMPNLGKNKDGSLKPLGIHLTIGYPVNGRVDDSEFIDGVAKAGKMNLDNSMRIYQTFGSTL
jgi:hypothetical protein